MTQKFGGKELLVKAKTKAKRREKRNEIRRGKSLVKRQAKKLVGITGAPRLSPEASKVETPNQN
jgi:hypothetical protein